MNPVLLKPQSETGAQVVVQGRILTNAKAREYQALKPRLLAAVLESFDRLKAKSDLVLVEGAGSASEINLREGDIANMGFAQAADVPVVLVGDIDRGGVIAQIVGTRAVIDAADAAKIVGFIVNRFRGDPSLFAEGMRAIERHTGWPALGLVPHFAKARRLPAEDALALEHREARGDGAITIAVPVLPRISNFDDLDPLKLEPALALRPGAAGRAASRRRRPRDPPRLQGDDRRSSGACAPKAGTSTSRRICAAAGGCSAFAAAIRCWAASSAIRTASRARRANAKASAFSTSRPC